MGDGVDALQSCFAALIDLTLAIAAGGMLLRAFIPHALFARVLGLCLAFTGIGLLGNLWAESASMSGAEGAAVWQAMPLVLAQTAYGHAALMAALAWTVSLVALLLRERLAAWPVVVWCALALVGIARAASGHAMESGWDSYAIWVHALHIAAGCIWAGTVFLSAALALSWHNWSVPQRLALAQKISSAATIALVVVAASGAANTWRMLGGTGIELDDAYTRLLAAKLGCVALAMGMGGYNRWRVMPALTEMGSARRFTAVLLMESVVLAAAMLLAAKLGTTMPPMQA
jgi:putative copper resistance protein D